MTLLRKTFLERNMEEGDLSQADLDLWDGVNVSTCKDAEDTGQCSTSFDDADIFLELGAYYPETAQDTNTKGALPTKKNLHNSESGDIVPLSDHVSEKKDDSNKCKNKRNKPNSSKNLSEEKQNNIGKKGNESVSIKKTENITQSSESKPQKSSKRITRSTILKEKNSKSDDVQIPGKRAQCSPRIIRRSPRKSLQDKQNLTVTAKVANTDSGDADFVLSHPSHIQKTKKIAATSHLDPLQNVSKSLEKLSHKKLDSSHVQTQVPLHTSDSHRKLAESANFPALSGGNGSAKEDERAVSLTCVQQKLKLDRCTEDSSKRIQACRKTKTKKTERHQDKGLSKRCDEMGPIEITVPYKSTQMCNPLQMMSITSNPIENLPETQKVQCEPFHIINSLLGNTVQHIPKDNPVAGSSYMFASAKQELSEQKAKVSNDSIETTRWEGNRIKHCPDVSRSERASTVSKSAQNITPKMSPLKLRRSPRKLNSESTSQPLDLYEDFLVTRSEEEVGDSFLLIVGLVLIYCAWFCQTEKF